MRVLVLLTDGFGGHGGIAKFNRDLLTALCAHPACEEVVVLPRQYIRDEVGPATRRPVSAQVGETLGEAVTESYEPTDPNHALNCAVT